MSCACRKLHWFGRRHFHRPAMPGSSLHSVAAIRLPVTPMSSGSGQLPRGMTAHFNTPFVPATALELIHLQLVFSIATTWHFLHMHSLSRAPLICSFVPQCSLPRP